MTTIALIRHAPTDWNRERRLQGRTDRPLTADAVEELRRLALPEAWAGADLIASTLTRSIDTALALADGREVAHDPRLVEQSFGDWEGHTAEALEADPESGFRPTHTIDWHQRAPGGESPADVWARVAPVLAERRAAGRPAILVVHKAVMRVVFGMGESPGEPRLGVTEIKRRRLYPIALDADARPGPPGEPVRLVAR